MRIEVRPAFDEAVFASERPVRIAVAKTLRLLQEIDYLQLLSHPGLNFEKLHGYVEPETGEQIYSICSPCTARQGISQEVRMKTIPRVFKNVPVFVDFAILIFTAGTENPGRKNWRCLSPMH